MIHVVELKYQVVEVERKKYVCGCGGAVETAPGPARAVEGGRYSLRFAIKVAFDKYVAHLPLERQTRLMAHHGSRLLGRFSRFQRADFNDRHGRWRNANMKIARYLSDVVGQQLVHL